MRAQHHQQEIAQSRTDESVAQTKNAQGKASRVARREDKSAGLQGCLFSLFGMLQGGQFEVGYGAKVNESLGVNSGPRICRGGRVMFDLRGEEDVLSL